MNTGNSSPGTMRATVYAPPSDDFPHVAVVFHTDGTILLARPFSSAEAARRYIVDVSSSLVAVASSHDELSAQRAAGSQEDALPDSALPE